MTRSDFHCCDHFNRFIDTLSSVQTLTFGMNVRHPTESICAIVGQQVWEADSRKRYVSQRLEEGPPCKLCKAEPSATFHVVKLAKNLSIVR